jgi:mannose-6-phosphate isomerase-like protein (cupin superfamily)
MFSFLRATAPARTNNASNNPIIYEGGLSSVTFHPPGSQSIMTHKLPPNTPENGVSIIQPPFHYHIYQTEYFHIRSGSGNFYRGLDPKPFTLSDAPGASRTASIPAGQYHRFENASKTEDFVLEIHLTPESYEDEQRFFRNFFGYLDDCKQAKVEPSLFQLLVFLHSADTPLALPLPTEWLGRWVSRVFLIAVAGWGRLGLGYKDSYSEYYEEGKSK